MATSFKLTSRRMLDAWISSPEKLDNALAVYGSPEKILSPTTILFLAKTRSSNPLAFAFEVLSRYRLSSALLDQVGIARNAVPEIMSAIERQRPVIGQSIRTNGNFCAAFNHMMLPEKNTSGPSARCIGLLEIKFLLPVVSVSDNLDNTDLLVLQQLREGASAKQLAAVSGLSHRTIQHRIERLKVLFRASTIGQLVALSIADALHERGDRERDLHLSR